MPAGDNPKAESQASRSPEDTPGSDMQRLLGTLDQVFSTFREQLRTETPEPFADNAKIAADTFNDIVAGLKFESRRPGPITLQATRVSSTAIELKWTDVATNAYGYRVERCQGSGCEDLDEIERLPSTARSFRDAKLSGATFYRYRVVAFNAGGETASDIVGVNAWTAA